MRTDCKDTLDKILSGARLTKLICDEALYMYRSEGVIVYVCSYVDDLSFTSNSQE